MFEKVNIVSLDVNTRAYADTPLIITKDLYILSELKGYNLIFRYIQFSSLFCELSWVSIGSFFRYIQFNFLFGELSWV